MKVGKSASSWHLCHNILVCKVLSSTTKTLAFYWMWKRRVMFWCFIHFRSNSFSSWLLSNGSDTAQNVDTKDAARTFWRPSSARLLLRITTYETFHVLFVTVCLFKHTVLICCIICSKIILYSCRRSTFQFRNGHNYCEDYFTQGMWSGC